MVACAVHDYGFFAAFIRRWIGCGAHDYGSGHIRPKQASTRYHDYALDPGLVYEYETTTHRTRSPESRLLFKAAKKAAAIDPPPDENIVEEQNQKEDRVQVKEIADHLPSPPLASPPPPASKPPAYDINRLPYDLGERLPIEDYPVNDQDAIRRAYITKGACKPYIHDFPYRNIGGVPRRFSIQWLYNYEWLEYSVKKDSAFCFICYLFKKGSGSKTFIVDGWNNWNIGNTTLLKHSGSRAHKAAQEKYIGFMNPKVAIDYNIDKWSEEELRLYKKRLTYSLRCIKFLLHQGLAFHGHDESEESSNRGNFIELLKFLAGNSEEVNKMQELRSNGWDNFLQKVTSFCIKHGVEVPAMDGAYVPYGKSARYARARNQTNDDNFRREVYIGVMDQISQELDNRFDEINMELLSCMSAFSPSNSFASFDARKVRRLAEFYPKDFSNNDLLKLKLQLDNYIDDMRQDASFQGLDNIVDLSVKLIETKRHKVYDMVYLLLKLILLLPVATASVERVFSALVIVKIKSRNKIGDTVLDDCLVTFIEGIFSTKLMKMI
ncbi:uncharacterized protein [Miscanthus floridulus]|uniref:uncharacterized protein n=1 Tax=Miscanthus floridulus TaxID=154761 RepID=UPI003458046C